MPVAGGSADLVICENCLDHVSRPEGVMDELARLRPAACSGCSLTSWTSPTRSTRTR